MLITAADSRSIHYSLSTLFRQVYVLKMANDDEYDNLLGRTRGIRPMDGLGRGLIRTARGTETAVYEFQVDVPFAQADNPYQKLTEFVEQTSARWGVKSQVFRLPETITLEMFDGFEPDWQEMPLALNAADGTPVCWDFWHHPILQCSMPQSAAQLRALTALAARKCTDGEVLVLDGAGFGAPLAENCTVVRGEAMSDAVQQLSDRVNQQESHVADVFEATGVVPERKPFLVVLYDTAAVTKQLNQNACHSLDVLLNMADTDHVGLPLYFITCSDYSENTYGNLQTLNRLRPANGFALQLPDTLHQNLFRCEKLGRESTGVGFVQDGRLIRCGFAEEKGDA